jgi:hypothetical protein
MTDIVHLLSALESAQDPVETIRSLVLEHGGLWCDPEHATGVFEIQLAGLVGIGPSAASAVDDWKLQARARLDKDPGPSA